jgi:hypothetical protein
MIAETMGFSNSGSRRIFHVSKIRLTAVLEFVTAALVLLPIEYQVPVRGVMFLLAARRASADRLCPAAANR